METKLRTQDIPEPKLANIDQNTEGMLWNIEVGLGGKCISWAWFTKSAVLLGHATSSLAHPIPIRCAAATTNVITL